MVVIQIFSGYLQQAILIMQPRLVMISPLLLPAQEILALMIIRVISREQGSILATALTICLRVLLCLVILQQESSIKLGIQRNKGKRKVSLMFSLSKSAYPVVLAIYRAPPSLMII